MKKCKYLYIVILVLLMLNSIALFSISTINTDNKCFFVENKGQWNSDVKFLTCLPNCNIWITEQNIVFDYYHIIKKTNFSLFIIVNLYGLQLNTEQ